MYIGNAEMFIKICLSEALKLDLVLYTPWSSSYESRLKYLKSSYDNKSTYISLEYFKGKVSISVCCYKVSSIEVSTKLQINAFKRKAELDTKKAQLRYQKALSKQSIKLAQKEVKFLETYLIN